MDTILNLTGAFRYLATMRAFDVLDILIVALVIYKLLGLLRRTNIIRVAKGIAVLVVAMGISQIFKLNMLSFLLQGALELGLIALVILFQPELRRALEKMGGSGKLSFLLSGEYKSMHIENAITQTVLACSDMAKTRTGAIIVFEGVNSLEDSIRTGTVVDAGVTAELLKNLFFEKAPLHDGAVIVRDGRIAAAGCMLPLSSNMNLSKELGMRHRAGIGISEQTDAVVVIVSEESGAISVAIDGMLKRHLSRETTETILRKELVPDEAEIEKKSIFERFKVKRDGK